jgi:hypothetical protein
MGKDCITWQYWTGQKICKIGGVVRLGMEGGDSPLWCEPAKPVTWHGKRIGVRSKEINGSNRTCTWESAVPTQCFGLGAERKINGRSMNEVECERGCCETENCLVWQSAPGRGCYYNEDKVDGIYCDPYVGTYEGGRKNVTLLHEQGRLSTITDLAEAHPKSRLRR